MFLIAETLVVDCNERSSLERLPSVNCQLFLLPSSSFGQLSTINYQLPTVNSQLFLLYKQTQGLHRSENQLAGQAVILLQVVTFSNNRLNLVSQES